LEKVKSRKTHLEHIALIPEKLIFGCDCYFFCFFYEKNIGTFYISIKMELWKKGGTFGKSGNNFSSNHLGTFYISIKWNFGKKWK
jgi:hypothetical protein